MGKFKLNSVLNDETLSLAKDTHKVRYIKRENIFPNPYNEEVYSTENIELLSYGIEEDGLLEPLIVRPYGTNENNEETYQIISGHRRKKAIDLLVSRNSEAKKDFSLIPVIVRTDKNNSDKSMLNSNSKSKSDELLLSGNLYNRNKTDAEIAKELAEKKRMMLERKNRGEKISGKLLEMIANEMNLSYHQAKKLNSINSNASDGVMKAYENNEISTETAYELSKKDTEIQEEIINEYSSNDTDSPLTAKKVNDIAKSKTETKSEKAVVSQYVPAPVFDLKYNLVLVSVEKNKLFNDEISERAKQIFNSVSEKYNIKLQDWNYEQCCVKINFEAHINSDIKKFILAYIKKSNEILKREFLSIAQQIGDNYLWDNKFYLKTLAI